MKKILATILILSITACGWQLRGLENGVKNLAPLPSQLDLQLYQRNSKMGQSLKKLLREKNIEISSQAPLSLIIEVEDFDKRPLAVTDTGVTAQYQLTLSVLYRYQANLGNTSDEDITPSKKILSWRNYDFDAKLVVAKNQEEKALLEEMREELSLRILDTLPR
ncbi:LPS-assembly lipoprotein LptE [Teredinibacter franksiae]|uniref:LPS-assembly lipoprotein LptE n=1 Tax=Teredinibacter franksiae TaxID=2761453 RepID=UPI00162A28BA|nr:LPS assembly lipoprotein LptE [Teredinibacter franksiae]